MTWPDWGCLALISIFAARGFFRGLVQDLLGVAGLVGGLWAAGWMALWVGTQWEGAQPAVVFWIGRWVVICACGLACAAIFSHWGRKLFEAMRGSWLSWVDRGAGVVLGVAFGVAVSTFLVLGALLAPWSSRVTEVAAQSQLAGPLMEGGVRVCRLVGDSFPGSDGLRRRFLAARARVVPAGPKA